MADESGDESSEIEDLYADDVDEGKPESNLRYRFDKKKADPERKPLLSYKGSDFPEVRTFM